MNALPYVPVSRIGSPSLTTIVGVMLPIGRLSGAASLAPGLPVAGSSAASG